MFEKTLKSLQKFKNFSQELRAMLQDRGISAHIGMVESNNEKNYVVFPDGVFLYCFAYNNRISYEEFNANGAPILHFCACSDFKEAYQKKNPHLLLIQAHHNAFEFSVYKGYSTTGWYADAPLRLCPMCSDILLTLCQKKGIKLNREDIQDFIFSPQFENL